jgi:hypothetical protein
LKQKLVRPACLLFFLRPAAQKIGNGRDVDESRASQAFRSPKRVLSIVS